MVAPAVASVIVADCAAVNVPLAGVITGVAALCGGAGLADGEEPALPQPIPKNTSAVINIAAVPPASHSGADNCILERNVSANRSSTAQNASEKPGCGRKLPYGRRGRPGNAAACEGDSVEIDTVKGVAAPLATATLAGTVHTAPKGTPEHAKVIVPAKLGPGMACKLKLAVCPAGTVAVVEPPFA